MRAAIASGSRLDRNLPYSLVVVVSASKARYDTIKYRIVETCTYFALSYSLKAREVVGLALLYSLKWSGCLEFDSHEAFRSGYARL
jgi:hypothetical protein